MAPCRQWAFDGTFSYSHARYETHKTYPLHIHDGFEIYCLLSGEVKYYLEGSYRSLHSGDFLIIRENEAHRAVVTPGIPYERITLHFTREFLKGFDDTSVDLLRCFCSQPDAATHIKAAEARSSGLSGILQTLDLVNGCDVPEKNILVKLTLVRLLLTIGAMRTQAQPELNLKHDNINDVVSYLSSHLGEPIQLDALANRFYINKYHLCHKFKQSTGMTITKFLNNKRVQQAHYMLQTGIPATRVAAACGFQDYSCFYRLFKRQIGLSPSQVVPVISVSANTGR